MVLRRFCRNSGGLAGFGERDRVSTEFRVTLKQCLGCSGGALQSRLRGPACLQDRLVTLKGPAGWGCHVLPVPSARRTALLWRRWHDRGVPKRGSVTETCRGARAVIDACHLCSSTRDSVTKRDACASMPHPWQTKGSQILRGDKCALIENDDPCASMRPS